MVSHNQEQFISQLESILVLNNRYEKLRCVSIEGQKRRGVLSLVFQGYDRIAARLVAIKVMDPDRLGDAYRLACFEREPKLLELLEGKHRCLQLVQGLDHYKWQVNVAGTKETLMFDCGFFVTEWIEEDVDEYYYNQDVIDTDLKLRVFRNLLLAIEAIHSSNISHRDLKLDNIRLKTTENGQVVVAIDFGTSARIDAPNISDAYEKPVGAPIFAPPEAWVGFAGDRDIGHLADNYALGSLLFDLFNSREFCFVRKNDTNFNMLINAFRVSLGSETSRDGKLRAWSTQVKKFRSILHSPVIDGPGHTIPASISPIIKDLYEKLTEYDFRNRLSDLKYALQRIDSALRALANTRKQEMELHRKRHLRKRRQENARQKQERLLQYLTKTSILSC